jgi:hypothetical protein
MHLIMKNSIVFVLLLSYPLLTGCQRKVPTYGSPAEVANAMTRFSQAGRFDQAVQTGQEWIRTHPQDSIIYQQLGMAFVIKSSAELNHRRALLNEASRYYERSITVAPGDPVAALLAASGIENVGRVASPEDRCQYFHKAKSALVELEPSIVGDHFQLKNGQVVSLATVRTANDQVKSKLLVEMTQAECK